jgi:hypothetical protein
LIFFFFGAGIGQKEGGRGATDHLLLRSYRADLMGSMWASWPVESFLSMDEFMKIGYTGSIGLYKFRMVKKKEKNEQLKLNF